MSCLFVIFAATGTVSYHYKDVVAQAYCSFQLVSEPSEPYHISAVRRDCSSSSSCDDICGPDSFFATSIKATFPEMVLDGFTCRGGVWVMMDHPVLEPNPGPGQTDAGLLNLVTISYSYDRCNATGCGPNYCCCSACGPC